MGTPLEVSRSSKTAPSCLYMNFVGGGTHKPRRRGFPKHQSLNPPQLNFDQTRLMISRYLPMSCSTRYLRPMSNLTELQQNSLRKATIPNWLIESLVWWTSLSTSAASPRQVLASQAKRSAKIDVYQSPTGTGKTAESKLAAVFCSN